MSAAGGMPAAIGDLVARQRAQIKFSPLMPLGRAKKFHTDAAAAAICGYTLARIEDDHGCEAFIATREAETLRFRNLVQVDNWVECLIAQRVAGRPEGRMLRAPRQRKAATTRRRRAAQGSWGSIERTLQDSRDAVCRLRRFPFAGGA